MSGHRTALQTTGTVIGTVLTIVGLANVPSDIGIWLTWIQGIREVFPWWALVAGGLLTLVITWRAAISRSKAAGLLQKWLFSWTPSAKRDRERRERLGLVVSNLALPAAEHARQLLRVFMHNMSASDEPARKWLAGLVQGYTLDAFDRAAVLLVSHLPATLQGRAKVRSSWPEIADLFSEFWYRYQALSASLLLACEIDPSIGSNPVFPHWRVADGRLLSEIEKMVTEPGLQAIGEAVKRTGWGDPGRRLQPQGAA